MNTLLKIYKLKQEKQLAMSKLVGIQPKRVFGLRIDVVGNVHFTSGQELVYPAAGVLVVQDLITNNQKYLRFPENIKPEMIVISPNRKLLAVAELNLPLDKTLINIYDMDTLKKVKTLNIAPESPVQAVGYMNFTCDSKGLAVLSQEPDTFITMYQLDKADSMVTGRASNKNYPGKAEFVQCNPSDVSIVTVGGESMLKIMNKTEKGFGQLGTIKGDNINVTSLTWLTSEVIIAGSAEMELYFIEGGELKGKFNILDLDQIDLSQTPDAMEEMAKSELSTVATLLAKKIYPIKCLTTFQTGFAFATNNMVHVFYKESMFKYHKKTLLTIPVTLFEESLYAIKSIAINEQEDTVVATTHHSQIFIGQLFAPETMEICQLEFKYLGEPLHIDSIIDVSVCSWKTLCMTASRDHTIRIWNYETMKLEFIKKYLIDIRVIALHCSGMFAAIGFTDVLRLVQIQLNDLKIIKSLNYPMTSVMKFSHRGHYLAVGCEKIVAIISVFTFETVLNLKGHNGILSLAWSEDDRYLVSSGKEGSVYEWDINNNGQRVNELVQKGTLYNSIDVASDQSYIVGVTQSAYLREISKSEMAREFRAPDTESVLTTLAFSRSDQVLFTANSRGCLYGVKLPFYESGGGAFTNNRFYHKAINRLCMTFDDKMLISAGEDGTLVFWTLTNAENRAAEVDRDLAIWDDLLISRRELIEKIDQTKLLEMRIKEQIEEFQYQKQQGDSFHSEQMQSIHEKYCSALEDLKTQNETLKTLHADQLNELTSTITKSNEKHQREVEELEASFNDKIIVEYENQNNLKQQIESLKEKYEEKLRKTNISMQESIESMDRSFKEQLEERANFVVKLQEEIKEKEREFQEYCRQVEIDHDRNLVESQLSYEKRLKDSDEIITRFRGDAGVLKKKNGKIAKECEELRKEIELLRSQHVRLQETISQNQKQMEELKHDRVQRDVTIKDKEKQLIEMNKKNQDLESKKLLLTNKIQELKSEIEPRDVEIREKKERIFEMERELKLLQQHQLRSSLKLSELKDKFLGAEKELKIEKSRSKYARDHLIKICTDIHNVSGYIQKSPDKLKEQIIALFNRYANNSELKKSLTLDTEVQNEFLRQRDYYEKSAQRSMSSACPSKSKPKDDMDSSTVKLLKENVSLVTELNRLRVEMAEVLKESQKMKAILGTSSRHMLPSEAKKKLNQATVNREEIEKQYEATIEDMKEKILILTRENQNLRLNLSV